MSAHAADPPTATPGPRFEGPSALGGDLRRFWNLTLTLAVTDFKLVYFGSALGYVWSLMRPLLMFGTLYVVFTHIVRVGSAIPHYPLYLLTALILWGYFRDVTGQAVTSLVDRQNLLRKMRFPRLVIPLAVSLTELFHLGMNLIVVFAFFVGSGVEPRWGWLELPLLVLVLVVLATGTSMLISALYVRFRDMDPIWGVVLQLGFWGSPVIYAIGAVPPAWQGPLSCNPVATVLNEMRHALIDPSAPDAAACIGGAWKLLVPLGITLGVFALGWWVFNREAPKIAENL
jgi:ABC-2 type transport system permease protein